MIHAAFRHSLVISKLTITDKAASRGLYLKMRDPWTFLGRFIGSIKAALPSALNEPMKFYDIGPEAVLNQPKPDFLLLSHLWFGKPQS